MKASDLKGRAVLVLASADKVGHVDEVLFDPNLRQVLGFRVKRGAFGHAEALPRDGVASIGRDAVTVADPATINTEDRFPALQGAAALSRARGTKVVTEGGDLIGVVDELDLDDEAREVRGYTLAAPLLERLRHHVPHIQAADVLRLGEGGIMIVPNAVGERAQAAQ